MESLDTPIVATGSNVNVQHIHKLDWTATTLLVIFIIVVMAAGYQFGKAAAADTDKSRSFATLQNHIRDLEAQMTTAQYFQEFKSFLESRRTK